MKEYPKRELSDKEMIVDICRCGHGIHRHKITETGPKGRCNVCTCPKYIFEQQLTQKEALDLLFHIGKNPGV